MKTMLHDTAAVLDERTSGVCRSVKLEWSTQKMGML